MVVACPRAHLDHPRFYRAAPAKGKMSVPNVLSRWGSRYVCVCVCTPPLSWFFSFSAELPVELAPGSQLRSVDVVLDCHYIEEAVGGFPGAFAGSFSSDPATLVLRGVSIADDGSLDSVTNYEVPGTNTDSASPIIFEVSGE